MLQTKCSVRYKSVAIKVPFFLKPGIFTKIPYASSRPTYIKQK